MPTYEKCKEEVRELVRETMEAFEQHEALIDHVMIDLMFAIPEVDDAGEPKAPAIKWHGRPALAVTKILSLKDRAAGRGDCEITIDQYWWEHARREERIAALDHELFHIEKTAAVDDSGRPKLKLRKHDVEFGWFSLVATRHGKFSLERQQARWLLDARGQAYWPDFVKALPAPLKETEADAV